MSPSTENIQERYEQKFVFLQKQPDFVEDIVKNHPAIFHEIFQQRQVNNIYFDAPDLQFYSDHKEGNTNRKKVRIRWYGNIFGKVNKPVLEFKYRKGVLRIKKSYPLARFNNTNGCNEQLLKKVLSKSELPDQVLAEMENLLPQLVNTYSRRYFRSKDLHYRFTIDSDLAYFRFMPNQDANHFKENELLVLELKFPTDKNTETIKSNADLPKQDDVFSKYMSGMRKVYSHLT
ncbi:MAG: VTC domain-containing protein [Bacteroidales bacterium]|nr:VTC domain-containing protein [Bacteroidales bacterium]